MFLKSTMFPSIEMIRFNHECQRTILVGQKSPTHAHQHLRIHQGDNIHNYLKKPPVDHALGSQGNPPLFPLLPLFPRNRPAVCYVQSHQPTAWSKAWLSERGKPWVISWSKAMLSLANACRTSPPRSSVLPLSSEDPENPGPMSSDPMHIKSS